MRKIYALLSCIAVVASMQATGLKKVSVSGAAQAPAAAEASVTLTKALATQYAASGDVANFYIVLSDNSSASVDLSTGTVTASNANVVALDLYAPANSQKLLAEGTYSASKSNGSMTYSSQYSGTSYYGASGTMTSSSQLSGNVTVAKNSDGTYTVSATNKAGTAFTYTGALRFANPAATVYPQIGADVNTNITGGLAFYHGNLYDNKLGNIYINMYSNAFDAETGGMTQPGFNIAICAFNRLFPDSKKATVLPGTYKLLTSLSNANETFYAGQEVDYMGVTIVFGSYVKQRKALTGSDDDYAYSYIADGTVTITEGSAEGKFNVKVECTSVDGYKIQAQGTDVEFPVIDKSDDKPSTAVSNLDHDVNLNLDYIKTARAYNTGVQNGCNVFVIDLGSPSGKDGNEGDILRMEFLTDANAKDIVEGTYELMEYNHLYTNYYAPFKLVQGYFFDNGELTGTRYQHFKTGSYCVVDTFASVISGNISLAKVAGSDNYNFVIDCADGNGWFIKGNWTGPIEKNYDTSGVEGIGSNATESALRYIDADHIALSGASANAQVTIYTIDGKQALRSSGSGSIDISSLAKGAYIVSATNAQPIKFIRQ